MDWFEAIAVYLMLGVMTFVLGYPANDASMFYRRLPVLFLVAAIAPLMILLALPVMMIVYFAERMIR